MHLFSHWSIPLSCISWASVLYLQKPALSSGPGGEAMYAFSLAWLVAEGILSEDGLANLIGIGFKKGCVYSLLLCTLLLNSKVLLLSTETE